MQTPHLHSKNPKHRLPHLCRTLIQALYVRISILIALLKHEKTTAPGGTPLSLLLSSAPLWRMSLDGKARNLRYGWLLR